MGGEVAYIYSVNIIIFITQHTAARNPRLHHLHFKHFAFGGSGPGAGPHIFGDGNLHYISIEK